MAKVSVTDDPVPHGLRGYRKPYFCRCGVCRAGQAQYYQERKNAKKTDLDRVDDELARRRRVSQKTQKPPEIGTMEQAVIDECAGIEGAKDRPFVVASARQLAKLIDQLNAGDVKAATVQVSTMKQIAALMESLRPKHAASKRKSGGRLATVGNLTKVRRAQ